MFKLNYMDIRVNRISEKGHHSGTPEMGLTNIYVKHVYIA